MSKPTKGLLADALEALLTEKPLNKITVSEIAESSSVSRMTFYYHFKDIHDLLKWTFMRHVDAAYEQASGSDKAKWQQGLDHLFSFLLDNSAIVNNVCHSIGHSELQATCANIIHKYANEDFKALAQTMNITEAERDFVSLFCTNAVVGICFAWIDDGMNPDTVDATVQRCTLALSNSAHNILLAFEEERSAAR